MPSLRLRTSPQIKARRSFDSRYTCVAILPSKEFLEAIREQIAAQRHDRAGRIDALRAALSALVGAVTAPYAMLPVGQLQQPGGLGLVGAFQQWAVVGAQAGRPASIFDLCQNQAGADADAAL